MARQRPLFGPGPQVPLVDWADAWMQQHYPNPGLATRETIRREMWDALPKEYLPTDLRVVWHGWWMDTFSDGIARPLTLVFTDGRDGNRLDWQMALPFQDLETLLVGRLVLAKGDIDAVQAVLEAWIQHTGQAISVPATMARWRAVAGL